MNDLELVVTERELLTERDDFGDGLRVFAIAAGILARYRECGVPELTCPGGRMSPVAGGGQEARPHKDAPR